MLQTRSPKVQTLHKEERLSSKKDIGVLMKTGRWGICEGMKFCFLAGNGTSDPAINRIMVSVPKKFFKRAVKRNLLKRRIRESYRRQKGLLEGMTSGVDIMFQYNTAEILPYSRIYSLIGTILSDIRVRISSQAKAAGVSGPSGQDVAAGSSKHSRQDIAAEFPGSSGQDGTE